MCPVDWEMIREYQRCVTECSAIHWPHRKVGARSPRRMLCWDVLHAQGALLFSMGLLFFFWNRLFQSHSKSKSPKASFSLMMLYVPEDMFQFEIHEILAIDPSIYKISSAFSCQVACRTAESRHLPGGAAHGDLSWHPNDSECCSMPQISWRRWSWFQSGSSPSHLRGLLLFIEFQSNS